MLFIFYVCKWPGPKLHPTGKTPGPTACFIVAPSSAEPTPSPAVSWLRSPVTASVGAQVPATEVRWSPGTGGLGQPRLRTSASVFLVTYSHTHTHTKLFIPTRFTISHFMLQNCVQSILVGFTALHYFPFFFCNQKKYILFLINLTVSKEGSWCDLFKKGLSSAKQFDVLVVGFFVKARGKWICMV